MYMRKLIASLFSLSLLFCMSTTVFAATGFVDSPLWLSPESPKEGEMVTLSAAFLNSEKESLSGIVVFSDGDILLGKKPITIAPNAVATATIIFKIGAGDHNFSASMSGVTRMLKTGTSEPYSSSIETAELPKKFVAKAMTAQASAEVTTDFSAPILEKANAVGEKVSAVVPPTVKKTVTSTVGSIDAWRAKDAVSFTASKKAASTAVEKNKATQSKTTSSSAMSGDGPLLYVKLVWFTALAFIFSTPLVFYAGGIFLAFVILRFLYRKMRGR